VIAADKTIVQVSKIKTPGALDPENIHTPGIFVNVVVEVPAAVQEEVLIRAGAAYASPETS